MINRRVSNIVALLVASVWAASFIVSAIPGSHYQTDPAVHGVMTIVAGAVFASGALHRRD